MLATAVGPHLFWIASRAAGTAALLLASEGVCIGLLMSTRTRPPSRASQSRSPRPPSRPPRRSRRSLLRSHVAELRATHEALSLATLAALVVHGLTLLGDGFIKPTLGDVAIPFVSNYRTVWTSMGIVAFWMLLLLGPSYYVRGRIGVRLWRRLHRFTALAWLLGLAHSLGEGTDAGQTWFLAMIAVAVVPALALLAARVAGSLSRRAPERSRREPGLAPPSPAGLAR